VVLRSDRPHEVEFRLHAAKSSERMQTCVLSATMGNYARLRHLWLADAVVDSRRLWKTFKPDPAGFSPWAEWKADRLLKRDGHVLVACPPDEAEPEKAKYDPTTPAHWHYQGSVATQYWRARDVKGLTAAVNGRRTYWAGSSVIPGGVSFENFELRVPFA